MVDIECLVFSSSKIWSENRTTIIFSVRSKRICDFLLCKVSVIYHWLSISVITTIKIILFTRRYTYGKNVKGELSAVICLKHESYSYGGRGQYKRIKFSKCVNITREVRLDDPYWTSRENRLELIELSSIQQFRTDTAIQYKGMTINWCLGKED